MKLLSFIAASLLMLSTAANAQSKQVDIKKSVLTWNGKKVTGEHTGHILFKSGKLDFNGDKLKSGEFVVDMTSITCTDLEDEGYNKKLVGHLKSDDFFGVETYPTSKLVLSSVEMNGDKYQVKGKLTIKEKTHPIEFNVTKQGDAFVGKMVVDRAKYDVRYGSGQFFDNLGDKMIYDEFELAFEVYTK